MEKEKIISLVIGIMGLGTIAAPIIASSDVALWMWGMMITESGEVYFIFEETSASSMFFSAIFLLTTFIFVVGLVLHFLVSGKNIKLKMPAWLPGVIMTAGMGFPTIYTIMSFVGEGSLFPIVVVAGLIASIWAWVRGVKVSKSSA